MRIIITLSMVTLSLTTIVVYLPFTILQEHSTTSHLLSKLLKKENLNTLVVNLYPDNEGYTLLLRGKRGNDSETVRMPYEVRTLILTTLNNTGNV